ncbi:MAG: hypothetical protein PHQ75_04090 [Thermoguttaceae bacterium]|nr:hypothetical protein [Thermoguttaceae bacterium]
MDTPFRPGVNQELHKTRKMHVIAKHGKAEVLQLIIVCMTIFLFEVFPVTVFAQGMRNSAGTRRNDSSSEDLSRASTSRASADQIVGKIPWQYFSAENQTRIRGIISNHTLYRRLPVSGGYCNPEILDFVLCHPETIVGLWETLGYTELSLQRVGNTNYLLQDKAGTVGNIDVLFQSDEMLVIWCNGSYHGPVKSGEIVGEMLIVLQVRYTEDVLRKPVAICRLDSFVRVKNIGIDLMGRIFGPALGKIADNNLEQTFVFVSSISKTAEEAPDALRDLVLRTSSLSPQIRENFLLITRRANAQNRSLAGGEVIGYQLLPKLGQEHGNFARIIKRNPTEVPAATVQAWRSEDVPAHWQTGRVVTPERTAGQAPGQAPGQTPGQALGQAAEQVQSATLPESEALSNRSVRSTFGPTVPETQYVNAPEERPFSASVQGSGGSLPEQSQQKVRAHSLADSPRAQAVGTAARVPSPELLSAEASPVADAERSAKNTVRRETNVQTGQPAQPVQAEQSAQIAQPVQVAQPAQAEQPARTAQAAQAGALPLLVLPGTAKATVNVPDGKSSAVKKNESRTEIVPENTWRGVPSGK